MEAQDITEIARDMLGIRKLEDLVNDFMPPKSYPNSGSPKGWPRR